MDTNIIHLLSVILLLYPAYLIVPKDATKGMYYVIPHQHIYLLYTYIVLHNHSIENYEKLGIYGLKNITYISMDHSSRILQFLPG